MKSRLSILVLFFSAASLAAEAPNGVTFGGFIDTYYSYDFNHPPTRDRAFTTQPVRDNEFNVNLAYIEAKIEREKIHGRLALQAGTSVQSNYAAEPTVGGATSISGPTLSRHIQEAYAGYRLGQDTWIDAGIMLAHIGVESFISKDNLLYTRSLVADYSPYYETGVRLSTKFNDQLSAQFLVLNGWQNISENNSNKALGTQLSFSPSSRFTVIYNTFFGREAAFRQLHDFILKVNPSDAWSLQLQADLGFQDASATTPKSRWNGFSLMAKRTLSPNVAVNGRVERFMDSNRIVTGTATGPTDPFRTWGASIGVDTTLDPNAWWRNEVRGYWADSGIFPARSGLKKNDSVVVSSISLAF